MKNNNKQDSVHESTDAKKGKGKCRGKKSKQYNIENTNDTEEKVEVRDIQKGKVRDHAEKGKQFKIEEIESENKENIAYKGTDINDGKEKDRGKKTQQNEIEERETKNDNKKRIAQEVNLPLLAYGASIGWMSPMTPILQSSQSPRGTPLTDEEISWMASTTYVTGVPTVFLFGYMVDKIGRKYSLLICTAQFAACWTVKLLSSQVWALVIARGLVGTGMAGCFVVTPLYIKEISEDSIRGALGTLIILSQTVGNLLLYIVGDLLSYHATLWFCLALPIVHLCLSFILPETPSYLIRQGKTEQTARTLAWLRCRHEGDPAITHEMDLMKKELEQDEENKQFALKSILKDKILFRAFKITMILCLAREVCGTVPVLNFASDIFRMASGDNNGLSMSPNQQAILLGFVQVTGSALASSVVEKAGRKPLLFITSLVSGLGMCGLATWFVLRDHSIFTPLWVPILALCLCIFCDASGLQPVSFVVLSEMFSFKYRSTVTSIAMGTTSFTCFLQLLFFKPIASNFGIHIIFYFFGAVCLANTLYIALVVPETKMKSLSEIYYKLKTKKEWREEDNIKNVP